MVRSRGASGRFVRSANGTLLISGVHGVHAEKCVLHLSLSRWPVGLGPNPGEPVASETNGVDAEDVAGDTEEAHMVAATEEHESKDCTRLTGKPTGGHSASRPSDDEHRDGARAGVATTATCAWRGRETSAVNIWSKVMIGADNGVTVTASPASSLGSCGFSVAVSERDIDVVGRSTMKQQIHRRHAPTAAVCMALPDWWTIAERDLANRP